MITKKIEIFLSKNIQMTNNYNIHKFKMNCQTHNLKNFEYLSNFNNNDYYFIDDNCIFRVFLSPIKIFNDDTQTNIFYKKLATLTNDKKNDVKYETQKFAVKINLSENQHIIEIPLQSLIIKNKCNNKQMIAHPEINSINVKCEGYWIIFSITISLLSLVKIIAQTLCLDNNMDGINKFDANL